MKKHLIFIVQCLITPILFLPLVLTGQSFSYPDAWGTQGFSLQESRNDGVFINFSITGFALTDQVINGENMKDISLPGNFLFNDAGSPNLPGNGKIIAIPQGSVAEVEIISYRTETFQDVNIAPAPVIPREDRKGALVFQKNERIYNVNQVYPARPVTLSAPMKLRGVDAVMLGITPFQYNPVTKQLIAYRDMKVQVKFKGGNGHFGDDRLRSRWWDPILEDAIFNRTMLPKIDYDQRNKGLNPSEAGAEYLIITPNGASFIQWADSIKKFRTEQGILTVVKTLTEVGGNTTAAIEAYINNAYNTWTVPPAACLLLGDYGTDINSTVVSPVYNSYCVSDNIYADVTGDHMPEVVMARITANNAAQLQVMVSKFLNYERNPPTSASFYNNPITALGWQTERWFQICSEVVGGFWKNVKGKNPVRINAVYDGNPTSDPWSTATNTSTVVGYFGPSGLGYIPSTPQALGGWTGGNATAINTALNAGSFMLQHRDHGGETGWGEPDYSSTSISGLTTTELSYIMSINCLTGKYNYSSEVFAEKFHRYTYNGQNSGALGIMAASEVSYSFVNDVYVWGMFDNLWPDFMPAYGTTPASRGVLPCFGNAAGKIFLQQSSWPYNTGDKEVTYNLFHHHGDAFLTVYSEVPQNLTVVHNPVLYAGVTSFEVTANPGSLIALTVNGTILGTATGTGSPVSIAIPPQFPPDQMVVTVTLQNYFRYRALVEIIPASGPYVIHTGNSVSDPSPGGNNNGSFDYNEAGFLNMTVKNVGIQDATNVIATLSSSDTYVNITDNTENFGTISPNQSVTAGNAYAVAVAGDIPDQHGILFSLSSSDGSNTWNSTFTRVANAPSLAAGTLTIQDNGPGCNSDGILDPGETANLLIATSNNGHSALSVITATLAIAGGSSPYLTLNETSYALGTLAPGASGTAIFSVTADAATPIGTQVDLNYEAEGGSYSVLAAKQVVIGLIPTFIITGGSVTTCPGNFYDSGGPTGSYLDSENITETFYPSTPGAMIRFTFNSFATESGYDYLKIYNGTSTSSPLLGSYSGSTSPGTVTASNASGALTFNFTSDGSVTAAGWSAAISCYLPTQPPAAEFTASAVNPPVNSTVTFTDQSTNSPTSWLWVVSPATVVFMGGTSATSQNPQVQFQATGSYTVSMTATNMIGSNTKTKVNYINAVSCSPCASASTNATMEWISNVIFNTISNASAGSTGYQDFTALSTDVTPGSVYPLSVTCTQTGSWTEHIWAFFDWNHDCDFTDSGESTDLGQVTTSGTLTANVTVPTEAAAGQTRFRASLKYSSDPTSCETFSYGQVEDYTLNVQGAMLPTNLHLKVFLQGLYNGSGALRQACDCSGPHFGTGIADQVTVELHNASNYNTVANVFSNTDLTTSGDIYLNNISSIATGSYYITIKHRNSIETTTANPVPFSGGTVTHDFTMAATQAYGGNLLNVNGSYVIFSGDVNQEGHINVSDMSAIESDAGSFKTGYEPCDLNGDSFIDFADMVILETNVLSGIAVLHP